MDCVYGLLLAKHDVAERGLDGLNALLLLLLCFVKARVLN